jgi:hypothetical protein
MRASTWWIPQMELTFERVYKEPEERPVKFREFF